MKRGVQILLILGGYVGAFVAGSLAVWAYGEDRASDPSQGMVAFSQSLVFLAVFSLAAVPSTCFALFLLRRNRPFWIAGAVLAMAIALTAVWAVVHALHPGDVRGTLGDLSPVRILVAPAFALLSLLGAVICPFQAWRRAYLVVFLVESAAFVGVFSYWMSSAR